MSENEHSNGVIERIPVLRRFIDTVTCDHERICIVGTKEGFKADYQCMNCKRHVDPTQLNGSYRPVNSETE